MSFAFGERDRDDLTQPLVVEVDEVGLDGTDVDDDVDSVVPGRVEDGAGRVVCGVVAGLVVGAGVVVVVGGEETVVDVVTDATGGVTFREGSGNGRTRA